MIICSSRILSVIIKLINKEYMNTEGYTVFTGPLKHGPKGNQAVKKAEK